MSESPNGENTKCFKMENGSNIIPSNIVIHCKGIISDEDDFDDGEKLNYISKRENDRKGETMR